MYGVAGQVQIIQQGKAAFRAGSNLMDNPYPRESVAYLHWENGWKAAQEAYVNGSTQNTTQETPRAPG